MPLKHEQVVVPLETYNPAMVNNPAVNDPSEGVNVTSIGGIPSDLYYMWQANQALYRQIGKPDPIQYNTNADGTVTAIPYNNPSGAKTYPAGTTFKNVNGTPVPL